MEECKICNRTFNSCRGLWQHLKYSHNNMSKKEYFDKYFKNGLIGICIMCSGETKFDFRNFNYFKHCSTKCSTNNPKIREKTIETNIKKYGVNYSSQLDYYKKLNSDVWKNKTKEQLLIRNEKSKKTSMERYNVDNPAKSEIIKQKMKDTCLKEYGVEYALKSEKVKEKRKQTNLKLYGVENVFQNPEIIEHIRNILSERGYRLDTRNYSKFQNYNKRCVSLTKINIRKSTFKQDWDGKDYYDGEYIKDNYKLYTPNNENYPNIDHKISIIYGFLNDISIEKISSIDNLCFTKRKHNMSKNSKIEEQYKNKKSI